MKRIALWLGVFLVASCSLNVDSMEEVKEIKDAEPLAVGFGVYVNRGVTTKAGKTGELTTATLKDADAGFGVFSYYGNGALYNETSKPDFMYNQLVSFSTQYNVWTYSPVKYWPNEYGAAASSEAADRLTFFAYAPYVAVTPSTGVVTDDGETGILGMSRNISAGDPLVMYGASLKPGSGVDLCWGVAADNFTSSVDGDNNNVEKGKPFIDVIKPKTGDRLSFEFNHALSQLNVQVDADINNDVAGGDDKTRIYVRSVTFNGFATRGSLNLNSNTTTGPVWYDISGTGKLRRDPVTVYDGRTDGLEGIATALDVSEMPADLNPMIVQSQPYGTSDMTPGVTADAVNLFNNTDVDAPVMVIPSTGVPMTVTIVYDIETIDANLSGLLGDGATHGVSVENRITKAIQLTTGEAMSLSAGKKYVIQLHLGLTSVKFDAVVKDWDNTDYSGNAYVPENGTVVPPPYPVGTSGGLFSVSDSKQVYIATSNLMWEGTSASGRYSLMEHPWSMIETSNSVPASYGISASNSVQIGLFGWGTPSAPYMTVNVWQEYASNGFVDWGTMYDDGKWRTLSYSEWLYLLTKRSNAFGFAKVNDVNGLVIVPDGFTVPDGVTYTKGYADLFDTNHYTVEEWSIMQDAGAVFLPAAGHRDPNHGNAIINAGSDFWYWMSTSSINKPTSDQLVHDDSMVFSITADYRYYGCSVRLVYDKTEN